ncbi:MAG: flavodoxin [Firmicutes bacterium]|nr:flavodoxin [Bacillota bacterium]
MSKVAVVYWSGTGNTEAMAKLVAEGINGAGAQAEVLGCADFNSSKVGSYDAIAFGCPAMGDEVLEEGEFQPMFDECLPSLSDKKVGLFGSYGWGTGEWMNSWEKTCKDSGVNVVGTVIANNEPDDAAAEECKKLGASLS